MGALNLNTVVGLDANFWRLADRHLSRAIGIGEKSVIIREGKPGDRIMPPECSGLKPQFASAIKHGEVTCCFVQYDELRDGQWYHHVHGHWATLDGERVRQCWLTARH